jgi:hypothetical protein
MFSLMLDPKFKTLGLRSFVLCPHLLVEEYDKKFLFPMLLKCDYHLHPLVEFERGVIDQRIEEDYSLDILEMIANTIELSMKLINKELLFFKRYQVDVENIKCLVQWWEKHKNMFPTIGFYINFFLRILRSQIEITRIIFSLIGILVNFRRCHLQSENLDKLIFVNKNWPYDSKISYKAPSSLEDLIENVQI